jgi:hypothetical protein
MLPSSGIIVFLRTLWLVSAHEIAESDPRSSPPFGKIFSVRSWLRSQIGSLPLEGTVTPTARKCKLYFGRYASFWLLFREHRAIKAHYCFNHVAEWALIT